MSTFCRTCGTLTGVEGTEPTMILRIPQPDSNSPWAKVGPRFSQSTEADRQFHPSATNHQATPPVVDLVFERKSVSRGVDENIGATRMVGKSIGVISLMGWLVALSGPRAGKSWVISSGKNLIGRNPGLTVTLAEDTVSGTHASLWVDKDRGVTLVDRDSANGTFVNGQQIFTPAQLSDGDLVRVGESSNLQWVQFRPIVLQLRDLQNSDYQSN